jgi:hypothetical protein
MSISSTLNARIFRTNFLPNITRKAAETSYSYEKFVRRMLMKLTAGVNFINVFFACFFCSNVLFGIFSSYVLALAPKFRTKNVHINVDEIDGCLTQYLDSLKFFSKEARWCFKQFWLFYFYSFAGLKSHNRQKVKENLLLF